MTNTTLGTDTYRILEYIQEVKNAHIPADESNTLLLGIFGAFADIDATQIRNSIAMSSEWMNEIFPIRARLEKNLLTHATMANIQDLTAEPSMMDAFIAVREQDLLNNLKNDQILIDQKTRVMIGTFEFHLEFGVIIQRQKNSNNQNMYVARYDNIGNITKLTTVTNPYLPPPVRTKIGTENFIFIKVRIRQMEFTEFHRKVISNDSVENKTFEFDFENQLADFNVTINKNDGTSIELTPVYDNTPIVDPTAKYCFYTYIGTNAVKVRFANTSYIPRINDEINVHIITTKGSKGNFNYKADIITYPESDTVSYSNLPILVRPISEAFNGQDKKSIEDLKKAIPRELLSRGSLTSEKDLDNFFNVLNDKNNKLKFVKKIHNQFTRIYYSYLLLKDNKENIIPSNTVDIKLVDTDFDKVGDRLILRPGAALQYDKALDKCLRIPTVGFSTDHIDTIENEGFVYATPFTTVVTKAPLITSTYLTIFDRRYDLDFKYINENSFLQFIATYANWKRELLNNRDTYKMDIDITQNIDEDYKLVETDADGFITGSKIKAIAVFKDTNGNPFRWCEATPLYFDKEAKTYRFRFEIVTDDDIDRDSFIHITNLKDLGTNTTLHGFFKGNGTQVSIHILADIGNSYNNKELDSIVPGLDRHTLCNTYDITSGVDFFINFSNIISSTVNVKRDDMNSAWYFTIDSVPVVRYSYLLRSDRISYLVNYIMQKKFFLDAAILLLENQFGIDFKFFNTYGPSKIHKIGQTTDTLDRVNLELAFRFKFVTMSNNETFVEAIKKEIKNYIEDVDRDYNVHISNIMTHLKEKFTFISYIEFLGINSYDPIHQSIIESIEQKSVYVPEFINIGSKSADYVPAIRIVVI